MKRIFIAIAITMSVYHAEAQQISPGALYAASGSATANGVNVNWVLGSLNAFPELSPLPVKLIHFEGRLNAAGLAELNWETAEEVNNIGFEIQKSLDGKNWDLLAWVDGAGNSKTSHSYHYVDNEFTTTSFYRLRQVDSDDSYTYSKIVQVIPDKESLERFFVYPNPTRENNVKVNMPERTEQLLIFDQLGRKLNGIPRPGTQQTITLPHTGSFLFQIDTPAGSKTTKLIFY